jgi:hypothetical protein
MIQYVGRNQLSEISPGARSGPQDARFWISGSLAYPVSKHIQNKRRKTGLGLCCLIRMASHKNCHNLPVERPPNRSGGPQ